jgi:hypothetical protein
LSSAARYHSIKGSDVRVVKPTGSQHVPSAALPKGAVMPTPLSTGGDTPPKAAALAIKEAAMRRAISS